MVSDLLASLRRHGRTLIDIALPPMCPTCGERLAPTDRGMCADCVGRIADVLAPLCPVCGMTRRDESKRCRGCLPSAIHFRCARQASLWEDPTPAAIHALKYHGVHEIAPVLARQIVRLLAREFRRDVWDLIVPVPLHRARRRERGYNQAALIARQLSLMVDVPWSAEAATRHRPTRSQTRLSRAERLTNVVGAFRCSDPSLVAGRRVLLIDDVHTTGSTLNEVARALREAGAEDVVAVAAARAVDP